MIGSQILLKKLRKFDFPLISIIRENIKKNELIITKNKLNNKKISKYALTLKSDFLLSDIF
tara:strand:+ start:484 stop:666 length:183 start_codon:yes stop_codon:yes gene_type:complete